MSVCGDTANEQNKENKDDDCDGHFCRVVSWVDKQANDEAKENQKRHVNACFHHSFGTALHHAQENCRESDWKQHTQLDYINRVHEQIFLLQLGIY